MQNWFNSPQKTDSLSADLIGMSAQFATLRSSFSGVSFPSTPVQGQIFYKDLGSNLYELYVYNGASWIKEMGGDGIAGRMVQFSGPSSLSLGTNTDADVSDSVIKKHTQNTDTETTGDFSIKTVTKGLKIKEGSNATMGVATLVAGTVTVNTTKVTSSSRIFITNQNGLSAGFCYVSTRVVGTSFAITSLDVGDVSDIAWIIIEPV